MSALGQKQTCAVQNVMSTLPPNCDIDCVFRHVRFGPIADIRGAILMSALPPNAVIRERPWNVPKGKIVCYRHVSFQSRLFDHLVCRLCGVEQTFGLLGTRDRKQCRIE